MTIYKDQLEAVYKLIEKPETWTQRSGARDDSGNPCDWSGDEAVCWCPLGAAYKLFGDDLDHLMNDMELATGVADVALFNDTHTHHEVLALLKSAIERAPVRP